MNKLLGVLLLLAMTSCSNQTLYESTRAYQRNECAREPPSRYEECVERANKSYDQYERERKERLKK